MMTSIVWIGGMLLSTYTDTHTMVCAICMYRKSVFSLWMLNGHAMNAFEHDVAL